MSTLILEDIVPTRLVSGNRRIHHMVRAQVCAYWRQLAHVAARQHYGPRAEGSWHDRVRIVVHVRFPDNRRRDVANLHPYVAKPLVDGLVDARVISDDDDLHVTGPDLRRERPNGPHRITITITDQGEIE